jgi:addiction module RelB/DinJ family antitoxin
MKTQNTGAQGARINIRVNGDLKREVENILEKIGLNLSDAINIYLHKVAADKGIPFPLTVAREQIIGNEAATIEASFARSVASSIERKQTSGLPVARFDQETQRPYFEYPDGRKEYSLEG